MYVSPVYIPVVLRAVPVCSRQHTGAVMLREGCSILGRSVPQTDRLGPAGTAEDASNSLSNSSLDQRTVRHVPSLERRGTPQAEPRTQSETWISSAPRRPRKSST